MNGKDALQEAATDVTAKADVSVEGVVFLCLELPLARIPKVPALLTLDRLTTHKGYDSNTEVTSSLVPEQTAFKISEERLLTISKDHWFSHYPTFTQDHVLNFFHLAFCLRTNVSVGMRHDLDKPRTKEQRYIVQVRKELSRSTRFPVAEAIEALTKLGGMVSSW